MSISTTNNFGPAIVIYNFNRNKELEVESSGSMASKDIIDTMDISVENHTCEFDEKSRVSRRVKSNGEVIKVDSKKMKATRDARKLAGRNIKVTATRQSDEELDK